MKVLFMGTPAFAAVSLRCLLQAGHRVMAAVTRPDAAAGRGLKLRPSAVKLLAGERGLPVWQPATLKEPGLLDRIRAEGPDIVVVVAFGRLLPRALLEAAPLGAVNLHASLLPMYRGAAPAAWAIAAGETETGVTTMRMIERLDAGDILMQRHVPIGEEETAGQLEERLAGVGAQLLLETLDGLREGAIAARRQDESAATYAPALRKEDALVDWSRPAIEIARRVRAFNPSPVAHTRTTGSGSVTIRIWSARPASPGTAIGSAPHGTVLGPVKRRDGPGGILVVCGGGTALELLEVQPEGSRRMSAPEALSGRYLEEGDRLGGD